MRALFIIVWIQRESSILASVTFPRLGGSSFTYNGVGDPASSQTGDSNYSWTTSETYGQNHDVLSQQLGSGNAALTSLYDPQLNVAKVTPASTAPSTTYSYDDFGRLRTRTSPYSGTDSFTYDPAGNVLVRTDGNGASTTTSYDALNRPLSAVSVRSGESTETVSWTYDNSSAGAFGIGRVSTMTDPSGSATYTYERRGLLATTVQIANGASYPTAYAYDVDGNRTQVSLPSGRALTYSFDFADRPASVQSATTAYVSSAVYEPFGPIAMMQFGNGTTQVWSYDSRYLPSENKITGPGSTTIADYTYSKNAAGFVTQITDTTSASYDKSMTYGGLAGNALASVSSGSALWGIAQFSDTYNQNIADLRVPGSNYGLKYDRAFHLTSIFNGQTGTTLPVTQDAVGNETAIGSATYTYSPRNLLASGDGISYAYDGDGRRVSATASAGTRVSLYDPQMHLQSESALSSSSIAYDYIWFGGVPVAQEDVGGQTHWTHVDQLDTPFLQTDSSGAVYWRVEYAPFGAIYSLRTADAHQPLRMAGQEAEEFSVGNPNGASGRYYNGARWYRPLYGRYTQPDPLGYGAGSYGLYTFANNNPLNYVDPLGLICVGPFDVSPGTLVLVGAWVLFFLDSVQSLLAVGSDLQLSYRSLMMLLLAPSSHLPRQKWALQFLHREAVPL